MPIMCCCFIIDFKDIYDDVIWHSGCALAL